MSASLVFSGRSRPIPRVVAHPSEAGIRIGFRYEAQDLPVGEVIASAVAAAQLMSDGSDSTADVLESPVASVAPGGLTASVELAAGGADGQRHLVTVQSTLSGSPAGLLVDQFVLVLNDGPDF